MSSRSRTSSRVHGKLVFYNIFCILKLINFFVSKFQLEISKKLGFKAGVFLTKHDNPLGNFIGNQFEVEETIECLHGHIPDDIKELVTKFG